MPSVLPALLALGVVATESVTLKNVTIFSGETSCAEKILETEVISLLFPQVTPGLVRWQWEDDLQQDNGLSDPDAGEGPGVSVCF